MSEPDHCPVPGRLHPDQRACLQLVEGFRRDQRRQQVQLHRFGVSEQLQDVPVRGFEVSQVLPDEFPQPVAERDRSVPRPDPGVCPQQARGAAEEHEFREVQRVSRAAGPEQPCGSGVHRPAQGALEQLVGLGMREVADRTAPQEPFLPQLGTSTRP
jgi:hypothetical protein